MFSYQQLQDDKLKFHFEENPNAEFLDLSNIKGGTPVKQRSELSLEEWWKKGWDEPTIGSYLSEKAAITNEEAIWWGTIIEISSYGIFVYLVLRIFTILIVTNFSEIIE